MLSKDVQSELLSGKTIQFFDKKYGLIEGTIKQINGTQALVIMNRTSGNEHLLYDPEDIETFCSLASKNIHLEII